MGYIYRVILDNRFSWLLPFSDYNLKLLPFFLMIMSRTNKPDRMKSYSAILLFVALTFLGCSNKSKLFPGFSVTPTGIHYRLLALGSDTQTVKPSQYVTVNISYRTVTDSLFFQGIRQFQLTEPAYKGAIDECFLMLAPGDSGAFYIKAKPFFTRTLGTSLPRFINPDQFMRVDVKILEARTVEEFEHDKEAFLTWIKDFGEYEKVLIWQYMEGKELSVEPTSSGLYIIPQITTRRKAVEPGDTVTIHYEGRFFNGKIFDSTRKRNEPFQFVYGQKWQVIPGLEEAIGTMREGEKSMLIVPSYLAFGRQGNTSGIIPPFTAVVFELEIVEVKKGAEQ